MAMNPQRKLWNLSSVGDLQENVLEHFPAPRVRARKSISFSLAVGVIVTAGTFFIGSARVTAGSSAVSSSIFTVASGATAWRPPLELFFASYRQGFSKEDEAKVLSALDGITFSGWSASDDDIHRAVATNLDEKIANRSTEDVKKMLGSYKRA